VEEVVFDGSDKKEKEEKKKRERKREWSLKVKDDEKGGKLFLTVSISPAEALYGFKKEISLLDYIFHGKTENETETEQKKSYIVFLNRQSMVTLPGLTIQIEDCGFPIIPALIKHEFVPGRFDFTVLPDFNSASTSPNSSINPSSSLEKNVFHHSCLINKRQQEELKELEVQQDKERENREVLLVNFNLRSWFSIQDELIHNSGSDYSKISCLLSFSESNENNGECQAGGNLELSSREFEVKEMLDTEKKKDALVRNILKKLNEDNKK
jgi:hypothetical protein